MILRSRTALFALGLALGASAATWIVSAATGHTRVAAPELPLAPGAPYSQGVMAGDLLYVSGNVGTDPATGKVPGAFGDAARQSLQNLGSILKAAGLGWEDVVKVNVYVTDMKRYAEFNAIYTKTLTAPYPARTFLAVAALPIGGQVEVEAVAVRRK
jgi:2-iminobutanoate/2-iminopropanoate deaminase